MGLFDSLFGYGQPSGLDQLWMKANGSDTYSDTPRGAIQTDKNGVQSMIYNGTGMANQFDKFRALVHNNPLMMGNQVWDPDPALLKALRANPSLLNELLKRDQEWSINYYNQNKEPAKIDPLQPPVRHTVRM